MVLPILLGSGIAFAGLAGSSVDAGTPSRPSGSTLRMRRVEARMKTCPDCNGDGVIEKGTDDEQRCPTCGGSGFVADENGDNEEEVIKTSPKSRFAAGWH